MGAALVLIASLAAVGATAPQAVPSFGEYEVAEKPPTTVLPADLGSHPRAKRYRTLLRQSDRESPNFAGHFTIVKIGCGTSCALLAVVDRENGRVFFPAEFGALHWSMSDREDYGFLFKLNSRLIRACGDPAEAGKPACRFYEWTGDSARVVAQAPWGSRRTGR
jgi:hypothetical protein